MEDYHMRNSFFTLLFILLPLSQAFCFVPIPLLYLGGTVLFGYLTDKGIEKGTEWTLEKVLEEYNLENLEKEQCLRLGGLKCITDFQNEKIVNKWWRSDYDEIIIDSKHSIRYEQNHIDAKYLYPIFYEEHIFLVAMNDQEIEEAIDEIQYISISEAEEKKIKDIEEQWNNGVYNE